MKYAIVLLRLSLVVCSCASASGATFIVLNTDDGGPGSLRQAITDANAMPGTDTIAFNIPGDGAHTIAPASSLPAINDPVIIDGYTQSGSSPNTLANADNAVLQIEISGAGVGSSAGLSILPGGSGSMIRGLVINRFPGDGIKIAAGSIGNLIEGNFIGTDVSGMVSAGNLNSGVLVLGDANTIGGTPPAARNLISGNADTSMNFNGVRLEFANHNLVQGNIIGLDRTGTNVIANQGNGISDISGASNTFGGAAAGAGNLISGNELNGIVVQDVAGATTGTGTLTLIAGNRIGTDVTGTLDRGNGAAGVLLVDVTQVTVGGTTSGAANLISGNNTQGVRLVDIANRNTIQGNLIGTDATGAPALGNSMEGILIEVGSQDNLIGGTTAVARNVISGNFAAGVRIRDTTSTGNAVQGNSIFSNGLLGIDLGSDFITLNDDCDADTGPNNLQNFPVITSVSSSGGNTTISGTLNSVANGTYRIEFFANDEVDPSFYGEGQIFLGTANVTTDATCNASFSVMVPQIGPGQRVTTTATDPNGNTSEFSAPLGQLLNISTRLRVQTGENALIGGFIVTGSDPKRVIIRGIGPSLANFFPEFLADPILELHDGGGAITATNDNWKVSDMGGSQQAEIEATGIQPTNDFESALVRTLPAGNAAYTAIVRGKNNTTGIGLVEAYDLDALANSKLANISTRGFVDTGSNVMIGGFIAGIGVSKVIVRAIGPSLMNAGVPNALGNPTLELHDDNGTTIATNDNWKVRDTGGSQQAEIEATTIPPVNDLESALVRTLTPGAYTAVVGGVNNTTGVALVEIYNIP